MLSSNSLFSKRWIFLSWLVISQPGCISDHTDRYVDTSSLEIPPEIIMTKLVKTKSVKKQTGLGQRVKLIESGNKTVIDVNERFERTWGFLIRALQLNEIEVIDKNRQKGILYVDFTPDKRLSESRNWLESVNWFLFLDDQMARYKLTVNLQQTSTHIRAEVMEVEYDDFFDDDRNDFDTPIDYSDQLIKTLYQTFKKSNFEQ